MRLIIFFLILVSDPLRFFTLVSSLTLLLIRRDQRLSHAVRLISAGTTTPSRSTPTRACATRITSPTSSSSGAWQEWPCSMENCWTVSRRTPRSIPSSLVFPRFEGSSRLTCATLLFCRVFHQTFLQDDAGEADLTQRHGVCGTILMRLIFCNL